MPATCFGCGEKGHIESECPYAAELAADGKPPWCGLCDRRTRLIGAPGGQLTRCSQCHPSRRKTLAQHRRCPSCHAVVYEWDNGDCGNHEMPNAPDRRPEREHIAEIVGSNS